MTRGAPQAVGSAVNGSIGPVRTICPRWTPSTVQGGVRRRVSDDRAAPSLLQVLGQALASSPPPAPRCCVTAPLTPRRPPTATAASPATASAVASRHLATAASPHRSLSPPSSMSRHHLCYLAAEASKRCLAATRLILGRPLSTRRPEVR